MGTRGNEKDEEKWVQQAAGEEWARRLAGLDAEERARRTAAVEVLLAAPDEVSQPMESELYILREMLARQGQSA